MAPIDDEIRPNFPKGAPKVQNLQKVNLVSEINKGTGTPSLIIPINPQIP